MFRYFQNCTQHKIFNKGSNKRQLPRPHATALPCEINISYFLFNGSQWFVLWATLYIANYKICLNRRWSRLYNISF